MQIGVERAPKLKDAPAIELKFYRSGTDRRGAPANYSRASIQAIFATSCGSLDHFDARFTAQLRLEMRERDGGTSDPLSSQPNFSRALRAISGLGVLAGGNWSRQ